jgi:7-cyano-7-deazaguanine synthase
MRMNIDEMNRLKLRAIVLLSGGLDSTTTLAIAKSQGYEVYALSFRYGQRHNVEIAAAQRIASHYKVTQHVIAHIDLRIFGGSALTSNISVPKDRNIEEMSQDIPVTYVPARNTIFLSFALAWAEVIETSNIFIGVNALDYSGYPDCRPEYITAYESADHQKSIGTWRRIWNDDQLL